MNNRTAHDYEDIALKRELAVQRAVESQIDNVITTVTRLVQETNLAQNASFTKTQASQLLNFALQTNSPPLISGWIEYQAGRGSTSEAWQTGGLSERLAYLLSRPAGGGQPGDITMRPLYDFAAAAVQSEPLLMDAENRAEYVKKAWIHLIRQFVGYLRWRVIIFDSQRRA